MYPHRKTYTMNHVEPFRYLAMKMQVGALYGTSFPFAGNALDSIVPVDLSELMLDDHKRADLIAESLCRPAVLPTLLDNLLRPSLEQCFIDTHAALVCRILPLLGATPVGALASALGCSPRTLERSFLRVTGFTLKQCQSILRFDEIIEHVSRLEGDKIDWTDIAYEFGFSDQPHLIRHLKQCIGHTPLAYEKKRDLTIDVYGDFALD